MNSGSLRPTSQAADDLETIRRTLAGDRGAADVLAGRLRVLPGILGALNARSGARLKPQDLEDLAQDVLVIVWGKLRLFRGVGTLEAWLYRFCAYEFHNRRRRVGRTPQAQMLSHENEPPDETDDDFHTVDALREALRELGPPNAPVILLKHEGGHTFEEVGRILGIPPSTAKSRYYEGILWLRQRLARGEGGAT